MWYSSGSTLLKVQGCNRSAVLQSDGMHYIQLQRILLEARPAVLHACGQCCMQWDGELQCGLAALLIKVELVHHCADGVCS